MGYLTLALWAGAGVLMVAGWLGFTHLRDSLEEAEQALAVTRHELRGEQNLRVANEEALTNLMKTRAKAVVFHKELSDATPKLVPVGTALPAGWRVLHDAAAAGVSPAASSPAAAPVDAQAAAGTVIDNYAACREQDDAYQELQQWLVKTRPSVPSGR